MKVYLQLIEYDLKKYGIKFLVPILLIFLTTVYKLLFRGYYSGLFRILDPALDIPVILIFTIVHIIVPLGILYQLRSALNSEILMMIPDIRNKILLYKGSLLGIFVIWSLLIARIFELKQIVFYFFVYSWVISLFLIIVWGFKYIYKSNKHMLIKILFQFGILWVPYLFSLFKEFKYALMIISGYILLIWFIHFRNFIDNFRNYKEDMESQEKGLSRYLYGDFQDVFGTSWKEKDMKKALSRVSSKPGSFNYARLYQYSLYKYTGSLIMLIVVYYATNFIIGFSFNIVGPTNGAFIIGFFLLIIPFSVSKAFDKKDKIESLYLMNKNNRKEFGKNILLAVLWYNTRLMVYVILALAFNGWRFFKNPGDIVVFLHIVLPSFCIICSYPLIYLRWKYSSLNINDGELNEAGV